MMDGGLISLIGFLLMKLDMSSMLPMNTPLVDVIATEIMVWARAVQRIKTVSTVATRSQSNCIMDTNDFTLCSYTKKHLGWCN